jgi:hypothetical membrane protein
MSEPRSVVYQRMGAAVGIATPIIAFTCILIAIASYPAFSWTNNALSDLGIISGITGPLFNFGLYASGFFAFNFAIFGLFTYIGKSWVGKIGTATFAAATISLMAIGIFNESFSPTHYLVSVAFFTLLPISLWLIAAAFWLKHEKQLALFTLAVSLAAAAPWILYFSIHYVHGVAIPEFLSGLAGSIWIVLLGIKMIKSTTQSKA